MSTARVATFHLSKALHNYKRKYCFVGRVELKVYHVTISTLNSSFCMYLTLSLAGTPVHSVVISNSPGGRLSLLLLQFIFSPLPFLPCSPTPLTTLGLHAIVCWLVGWIDKGRQQTRCVFWKINWGGGECSPGFPATFWHLPKDHTDLKAMFHAGCAETYVSYAARPKWHAISIRPQFVDI